MDTKAIKTENLEVTGVSRSGRVRKKSSKLMDFESPDEVDHRNKRKQTDTPSRQEKPKKIQKTKLKIDGDSEEDFKMASPYTADEGNSDTDNEHYNPTNDEDDDSLDEDDDDDDDDDDEDDDDDDDDSDYKESQLVVDEKAPSQSLYLMEKNKKRIGKGVEKSQRRDKGKARFTAYMMWAKEVRQELSRQNHDMDFTTMAKRLSELWATVPKRERELWKREAKKASMNHRAKATPKPEAPLMPSRKFINKKGGPIAPPIKTNTSTPIAKPNAMLSSQNKTPSTGNTDLITSPYKITGIAPIDAAAHLKLLGESLSIIGERLQEHEGQIAVSGSMSVLFDSLLCAIGPLLCLTQQIDELQANKETFASILQNIAYIMPGLG